MFKGFNKLADTEANRALITKIANGTEIVVGKLGKSWYRGVDEAGKAIYAYTRNGIIKGAGYTNLSELEMIIKNIK